MEPLILIVKWPYLILLGNNYDQHPADKEVTKLRRLRRLRWDRFFLIFDFISSEFSERVLGDACHILVFLMIIVISVLFNLLAVTILLMKYSNSTQIRIPTAESRNNFKILLQRLLYARAVPEEPRDDGRAGTRAAPARSAAEA